MTRSDSTPVSTTASHARVEISSTLPPAAHAWLAEHASKALQVLGFPGEVRVRVVHDDVMAAAHEGFAGVPGTTDVLTFDLAEPGSAVLDVDILTCYDEAVRQAAARGHPPERELLLYIIHGVLHCLGHDDHDPAAAAAMHAEEDRILEAIGVGATFAERPRT
jgi:probable rRNA maturation factor